MVKDMKDKSKGESRRAMGAITMPMEIATSECGEMISNKATESFIAQKTRNCTRGIFTTTTRRGKGQSNIRTNINLKVVSTMVLKMARDV